jgi:ATP-dependent helicase/nuclease subunit A
MDTILQKDTDIPFPHFMILKASAGSGKTYALTHRFVQFILSNKIHHNSLRNILAVTFSNNAAKEMKERVLEWLKDAYFEKPHVLDELQQVVAMERDKIRDRAGSLIDEILGNYSDFQIKTIDSFMATVFKASAIDFGYHPEFDILLNNESVMELSFNLFLRNIWEHTEEAVLLEEIIDNISGSKKSGAAFLWDPSGAILEEVKKLYKKISSIGTMPLVTNEKKALQDIKYKIINMVHLIDNLINNYNIEKNRASSYDAVRSSVQENNFADLLSRGLKLPPVKKPGKKESSRQDSYQEILAQWEQFKELVHQFAYLHSRSAYIPYIMTYRVFSSIIESIKRLQGKVFIEDINRYLVEYLRGSIVPDVYFRLGDTVYHFLIDEFQDTSPAQWQNLIPLIDNSLSQGGSLFVVGDTKQAIYGFRDADYTIMRDCSSTSPFLSVEPIEKELSINYRSRSRILEFTRRVFQVLAPETPLYREALERSCLIDYKQTPKHTEEGEGYVEVTIHEKNEDDPSEKKKIQELILELCKRGYSCGDIAVLTQRNEDAVKVTAWLNEKEIDFISFSSLDIRRRKLTGEILSLLRFLDAPTENLSFATFILGEVFNRKISYEQAAGGSEDIRNFLFMYRNDPPLYKAFQKAFPSLWDVCFADLFKSAGYLPLYDLITEVFSIFRLFETFSEEESSLVKILETVKDLEGGGYNSIGDFLLFADGGQMEEIGTSDWDMNVPKEYDAVRVMTIHKAKGLGFPVVILLLYEESSKGFDYILEKDRDGIRLLKINREIAAHNEHSAELYEDERRKEKVNSLNTLYVGLTRAKYELYVIGACGKNCGYPLDILPVDDFPPSEKPSCFHEMKRESGGMLQLLHTARRIQFRAGPEELLNVYEKQRGEFIHRVLSFIDYSDGDISKRVLEIIKKVRRETGAEFPDAEVQDIIVPLIQHKDIAGYFTKKPGRVIRTEWEVADPTGRLFRMDRIVIDSDNVTIIDYKTGKDRSQEDTYKSQMKKYQQIVEELFPSRKVSCILVYVDMREIRKIA